MTTKSTRAVKSCPMPENLGVQKVWKHFYAHTEEWETISDHDVPSMRESAEELVGLFRKDHLSLPRYSASRWRELKPLLADHHTKGYAATYMADLESEGTMWAERMTKECRAEALTPKSIFIVVELGKGCSWVVTAYRPCPRVQGEVDDERPHRGTKCVLGSKSMRRAYSLRYFQRKTGMISNALAQTTLDALHDATAPASTRGEMWCLASAVGFGRWLGELAEVQTALAVSEQALRDTPEALKAQLKNALLWNQLSDEFSASLKENSLEDFEAALMSAEELLAVAHVVGAEAEASEFLALTERLLPWLPLEWTHILNDAQRRLGLGDDEHPIRLLWGQVDDAALSRLLRKEEMLPAPDPTFVDALIPRPKPALERVMAILRELDAEVRNIPSLVRELVQTMTVPSLSPMMSGTAEPLPAQLALPAKDESPHRRFFVVTQEYPQGYEVTELARRSGRIWDLEAKEGEALVIVLDSATSIPGSSLEEALAYAKTSDAVELAYRVFKPIA